MRYNFQDISTVSLDSQLSSTFPCSCQVWFYLLSQNADGSSAEAMDIDKDESKYSGRKNGGANIEEAINLDSDSDDEDLGVVEHRTSGNSSHALRDMSGDLHLEQPAGAAVPATMDAVSPRTPRWNYVDPQGNTQGPFPLFLLKRWSGRGFFDKDFKVWRTGETVEQAILLTDAFLLYL
jgi:hypothetical protein